MTSSRISLYATLVAICLAGGSVLTQRAGSIDTISPAAARPGDSVTITGRGFGAINVGVTVGGVPAAIVAANGNSVTFRVPAGVPQGSTTVTATNPGGQSGSIAFQIIEGVLLSGAPASPAIDAMFDLREIVVDPSLIDHHVILTRLDVRIAPDATIGQINAALIQLGGGIVSMTRRQPEMTIAVPRQSSIEALQRLASTLSDAPGILIAIVGRSLEHQILPPSSTALLEEHTLPTRFPAAWNVMSLAARDCDTRRLPVLVADDFIQPEPNSHVGFDLQVPFFDHAPLPAVGGETHGYDVTTTLTALFDDKILTGANPLAQCVSVHAVETDGITLFEGIDRIVDFFPNERFVMNLSQGFGYDCDVVTLPSGGSSCTPVSVVNDILRPFDRAWYGAYWKKKTHDRWNDFFAAASAGNNRDEPGGIRYSGVSDGRYNSFLTVAKEDDPFFDFITDTTFWRGTLDPNLPDLTATPNEVEKLKRAIEFDHLDTVGGASNALIVGSTTAGTRSSDLHLSAFSGTNSDVSAVGENIRVFTPGTGVNGTSYSSPQVAGLVAYLWLLSDDLRRNQPIETTRRNIIANARSTNAGLVIDAYATVLSLDRAQLPTPQSAPVRLALLDVDDSRVFDEADITAFVAHLLDANGDPVSPTTRDYSRYDLNGDGFTGGSGVDAFDLDRVGSDQYGAASYSPDVTQTIQGATIDYNETTLTDLEILCYYAYSSLYGGSPDVRDEVLRGHCVLSIDPTSVTLQRGAQQQFTAHTPNNGAVTWSASGGTITTAGLYTAGNFPGTFAVRATSVADPNVFAEATVTISGTSNIAAIFIDSVGLNVGRSRTITAIAVDVDGNEVTVAPGAWSWSIAPTGIASLAPSGSRATLTGVSQGTATLTVSVGGLSATSRVVVNNLLGTYQGTVTAIGSPTPDAGHVVIFLDVDGNLTMTVSLVVFGNIDTTGINVSGTSVSGTSRSYIWSLTSSASGGALSGTGTHRTQPLSWQVEVVKVN
jgi:subtilase family protein/IPT/TIG domain-containing protein